MSDEVNSQEGRISLRRRGRAVAVGRSLLVSLAQIAVGVAVTYACLTALSVVARASSGPPGFGGALPFMVAYMVLAPVGAMIVGPKVAQKLQLAARRAYCLSVVAVILVVVLGAWNPVLHNVPLLFLVLAAVNLLVGSSTGMHRNWSPPAGASVQAS
ncbi:hypothetical protein AB0A73_12955 [Glycomyces sp. NPDC047369]